MKKEKLQVNRKYIRSVAEKRFKKLVVEESQEINRVFKEISYSILPECNYAVFFDIEKTENGIKVFINREENQFIEFHSNKFDNFPKEILQGIVVYATTIGRMPTTGKGIFYQGIADMVGTAYIDILRDYLRETLEEDYIVGPSFSPGNEIGLSDIEKINSIIDFSEMKISINESFSMIPQKSACGIYLIFQAEHPVNTNNCETCMARGYGCNLCNVGGNHV